MERIKFSLFKIFIKTALWFASEEWIKKKIKDLFTCLERQRELDAHISPRTHTGETPTISEITNRRHYTDLDERNEYIKATKGAATLPVEIPNGGTSCLR
jgi:hypothetical protein